MKKLILPVLIVLLFGAFKAAKVKTQTISGTVTELSTGQPIPGVSVYSPDRKHASTDQKGKYSITVPASATELTFVYIGYETQKIKIRAKVLDVAMKETQSSLNEVVIRGYQKRSRDQTTGSSYIATGKEIKDVPVAQVEQLLQGRVAGLNIQNSRAEKSKSRMMLRSPAPENSSESYASITENQFRTALTQPLSTFSIDVDAASYTNLRRYINNGGLPPADAVRIEEMINYFDYDYAQPKGDDPVNITTEISSAPWNTSHKLVKIGLQGKKITTDRLPASNLVFLIDVSGSMAQPNKLPLLVSSFKLLTEQLRPSDKVAIVVYAGQAGMVLPSTPGDQKIKIKEALNQLSAGGSTAGGQGIELAYKIASDNFIKNGNNRVILATDGDFNVGASSDDAMQKLIENKRKSGIFLTVLGYGMGNIKDSKMEVLADKGNGNYAYIDNITEARKVLISEFGGTLFTIAKDVKLQVEFNPAKVQAYRLVGYENRMLKARDFNDDLKDAGEMGAGHTVTALYEVIPVGVKSSFAGRVDDLKYQSGKKPVVRNNSGELLTVKMRYKKPDRNVSKLIVHPVADHMQPFGQTSENFRFSAAVAEFGMLLRQSDFKQNASFDHVISSAQNAIGKDNEGYRAEFVKLAKSAKLLAKELLTIEQTNKIDEKN
ncbi:MAG TPA: von Willebrand factor type A domain-containing protein [Pedobacter sp.]|uniref:vWA domain-containing protein n=1 Tax=Pedobacter sp. TaxID=1411316 RepID=UPI002C6BE946|nr:von Willebrand factor type A domain-containing protein [Pedobacter sp.]HMI04625.1 von Willebrand factor type A domain-containing protein [Pedobacter sp.]